MNNACPECGVVYAVAEKDIGRRIACKKCNSALVVTDKGLERDEAELDSAHREDVPERDRARDRDDDERGRRRRSRDDESEHRPRKAGGAGTGQIIQKLKAFADVPTWLYGLGLLLTIYTAFTPALDSGTTSARVGEIVYAKVEDQEDERQVNAKNDGKPNADDRKARDKRREEYAKELPRQNEKVQYAEAAALKAVWWNVMYHIVSLAILAIGAVAFLIGDQPQMKRIVGAITIGIILLNVAGRVDFRARTSAASVNLPQLPGNLK